MKVQPVKANFAFRFLYRAANRMAELFWSFIRFLKSMIIPAMNFVRPSVAQGSKIDPNMRRGNSGAPAPNVPKQEVVCEGDVCYIRKK
jgi:hypothetical protein